MGIFDSLFRKPIQDLYIARPQEAAQHLIWRYPEQSIPNGAKLTVRSDESVIFFREGRFAGSLEAGTYVIDSDSIPFIDQLIVSGLTGGNHYICELFFVRKAEFIHATSQRELGTYTDLESRHVVTVQFNARFGVVVSDALALITTLGGQTTNSSETIGRFLDARLKSLLAAIVGQLLAEQPALSVMSNTYNERIGQMVREQAKTEFSEQGLELNRFLGLNLDLDDDSEQALKDFGRQRAKLNIEREGAAIAGGYANYQLAQGQRAALEGIGEGMGSGKGPNAIMGMNIGGGGGLGGGLQNRLPMSPGRLTGPPHASHSSMMPAASKVKTAATMKWLLQSSRGVEGPYTVRQVVLRAISDGLDAGSSEVRGEEDPDWFLAETEPVLVREFQRRLAKGRAKFASDKPCGKKDQFETVFKIAVEDTIITEDEMQMLVPLAIAAGIGKDEDSARRVVLQRIKAYGCTYGEPESPSEEESDCAPPPPPPPPDEDVPPPPPPPPPTVNVTFSYSDGKETLHKLTISQVVERVKTDSSGYHVVWNKQLGEWKPALDVESIAALID